jgi:hypothetical protein
VRVENLPRITSLCILKVACILTVIVFGRVRDRNDILTLKSLLLLTSLLMGSWVLVRYRRVSEVVAPRANSWSCKCALCEAFVLEEAMSASRARRLIFWLYFSLLSTAEAASTGSLWTRFPSWTQWQRCFHSWERSRRLVKLGEKRRPFLLWMKDYTTAAAQYHLRYLPSSSTRAVVVEACCLEVEGRRPGRNPYVTNYMEGNSGNIHMGH